MPRPQEKKSEVRIIHQKIISSQPEAKLFPVFQTEELDYDRNYEDVLQCRQRPQAQFKYSTTKSGCFEKK